MSALLKMSCWCRAFRASPSKVVVSKDTALWWSLCTKAGWLNASVSTMKYGLFQVLFLACELQLVSCFVLTSSSYARKPASFSRRTRIMLQSSEEDDVSLETYWEENSAKWEKTLRILDVKAAWQAGSLNGILPSGA